MSTKKLYMVNIFLLFSREIWDWTAARSPTVIEANAVQEKKRNTNLIYSTKHSWYKLIIENVTKKHLYCYLPRIKTYMQQSELKTNGFTNNRKTSNSNSNQERREIEWLVQHPLMSILTIYSSILSPAKHRPWHTMRQTFQVHGFKIGPYIFTLLKPNAN